jgi:hypothetical protein
VGDDLSEGEVMRAAITRAVCAAVVSVLALPTTAQAATPKLVVNTTSAVVPSTRYVPVKVTCATKYACKGTLALYGAGSTTKARYYSLASRTSGTYRIQLWSKQFSQIPVGTSKAFAVRVTESKPAAIKTRSVSIVRRRTTPARRRCTPRTR